MSPYTTHKLQPLDVAVYGPFSKYFQVEIDKWQKTHPAQHVTFYEIGQIFTPAYLKAAIPNNAIKGFIKTGISDCNMDVFSDYDFLPPEVTEIDIVENNTMDDTIVVTPLLNDSRSPISSDVRDLALPSTSKDYVPHSVPNNTEINEQYLKFDSKPTSSASNDVPSISKLSPLVPKQDNVAPDKPVRNEKIKIIDIHVIPKCTKRIQKTTRKCQKSEVLTSTPVKEEIRNNATVSRAKRKIGEISAVPIIKMPKPPVEKIKPDENTVACILCGDVFGNSKPGEEWIECNICAQWAHKLCADYNTGVFICDLCRGSILSSRK